MTVAMKAIAEEIYQYLKKRFVNDDSVIIQPFNHVTVLFYYLKEEIVDVKTQNGQMLGYHTDNVYSYDGFFEHDSNSQMENTFT